MLEKGQFWRNQEIRKHVAVVDEKVMPTLVLKNGTYLNIFTKQWIKANIWVYDDRIVYVGSKLPTSHEEVEIVNCAGKYLVPGYIEPHAHPFQLYNPEELAIKAATHGTTTLINDNLLFLFLVDKKKAFTLLENFTRLPISMYWWARYDSQTALLDEETYFNTERVFSWLKNDLIVQGGELTSWPQLLDGDDRLLAWIRETERLGKQVEGHFPGASEKTLTKMKLFGVSADHEAMTGKEVINRLELGFHTSLRNSSIRPDLQKLSKEILAEGLTVFDHLTMTTDGSTPGFYENGLINICIEIAIQSGVPVEEAYRMATYNAAKHLDLDEKLGSIAPGRIAHINILEEKNLPHPVSVLAKGKWIVKDNKKQVVERTIDWNAYNLGPLALNWSLTWNDLQFSTPIGLQMINDVIMKPFAVEIDLTVDQLSSDHPDAFLLLIDRHGKWRVNSVLQGFTNRLGALASSHSTTGDIVIIGKSKSDMMLAWQRLKQIGGGIVLAHQGTIIFELPLKLSGFMYDGNMRELIEQERELKSILNEYGYEHGDSIYSIFFLSSTHLPYIRITEQGIIDVMKRKVIFPAIIR